MSKFEDTSISYDLKNRIIKKKDLASGGSILNRYSSHYTVNLGAEGELNVAIKDSFRACVKLSYIKKGFYSLLIYLILSKTVV